MGNCKYLLLLAMVLLGAEAAPAAQSTTCVSSCKGLRNGDYQSCIGCDVYVTCVHGNMEDNRPCPTDTFWDDIAKKCLFHSRTCDKVQRTTCVSSCKGLRNGDYQSCHGCDIYVTCFHGNMEDNRPCPANTFWDDLAKKCLFKSSTCHNADKMLRDIKLQDEDNRWCLKSCKGRMDGNYASCKGIQYYATCVAGIMYDGRECAPGTVWDNWNKICNYVKAQNNGVCITSCHGRPDGNYQSCRSCNVFASCTNGILVDNRPCAANLVWDDRQKECRYTSTTCQSSPKNLQVSAMSTFGERRCLSSCRGVPDGDYQSCFGCRFFVSCSNGRMFDRRLCPGRLVWDDVIKRCSWGSRTCQDDRAGALLRTCVDDCENVANGDYQSCKGCGVYATCTNGVLIDNRPCALGTVWDDIAKKCMATSTTCDAATTEAPTTTTEAPATTKTTEAITKPPTAHTTHIKASSSPVTPDNPDTTSTHSLSS